MRSRGMVVAVAFLLAMTATLAVFLYVKGVRDEAETGGELVSVIVSDQDIPAGTDLDGLIAEGAFSSIEVSQDALVAGAVENLSELEGQETSAAILEGEQISTARIQGVGELPGGALGIPDGFQALSVAVQIPRAVGGELAGGDHVTIYATFDKGPNGDPITVTLVPDVLVLDVLGLTSGDSRVGRSSSTEGMVTLALNPKDSQELVFAREQGEVYFAVLPPGQDGDKQKPSTILRVVK